MEKFFQEIWQKKGFFACLFFPFSLIFRFCVAIRRTLYSAKILSSTRLPVPVIIVGNIFVGGTGKTPLVIALAKALKKRGLNPAIISRGYKSENEKPRLVGPNDSPENVGDEPLLMAKRADCPLMIGRKRAQTGVALLEMFPETDVIISDDGLQHYALQRDVEIILFDERGFGNGWMLPAGPLREPKSRTSDFFVFNSTQKPRISNAWTMKLIGNIAERINNHEKLPLENFATQNNGKNAPKILAAAGIGNPQRFFNHLQKFNINFETLPLPDHFDYKNSPFTNKDAEVILITEKDAVKCAFFESPENLARLWVVPVRAQIEEALITQIIEKIRGFKLT